MKNKTYLSICCAVNYLVAGLNFDGAITEIIFGRDLFWITGSFIFFCALSYCGYRVTHQITERR